MTSRRSMATYSERMSRAMQFVPGHVGGRVASAQPIRRRGGTLRNASVGAVSPIQCLFTLQPTALHSVDYAGTSTGVDPYVNSAGTYTLQDTGTYGTILRWDLPAAGLPTDTMPHTIRARGIAQWLSATGSMFGFLGVFLQYWNGTTWQYYTKFGDDFFDRTDHTAGEALAAMPVNSPTYTMAQVVDKLNTGDLRLMCWSDNTTQSGAVYDGLLSEITLEVDYC